jgi:hypothetical protein
VNHGIIDAGAHAPGGSRLANQRAGSCVDRVKMETQICFHAWNVHVHVPSTPESAQASARDEVVLHFLAKGQSPVAIGRRALEGVWN